MDVVGYGFLLGLGIMLAVLVFAVAAFLVFLGVMLSGYLKEKKRPEIRKARTDDQGFSS